MYKLNIEVNYLAPIDRFLKGVSNKNPYKLIRFDKLKMYQ